MGKHTKTTTVRRKSRRPVVGTRVLGKFGSSPFEYIAGRVVAKKGRTVTLEFDDPDVDLLDVPIKDPSIAFPEQASSTRGQLQLLQRPTIRWVHQHNSTLVSVLSCTPDREDMLNKCLEYWTSIGAHVLLFVPHGHVDHFVSTHENDLVKVVSYRPKDPAHMFVGHSRNAVLQFCSEHPFLQSMAMVDERVYKLAQWTESFTFRSTPEERFWLLKQFLATGSVARSRAATDMGETFQHMEKEGITLVSISDNKRNRNRKYSDPAARIPVIAQLVLFKLGTGGWDRQFWYPECAMGEDIHFSYKWSQRLGGVMECRTVTMLRNTGKTITRKRQDVPTYTDDNLLEAHEMFQGGEYAEAGTFQWCVGGPLQRMSVKTGQYAYNEMECMMKGVWKEYNRRSAMSRNRTVAALQARVDLIRTQLEAAKREAVGA
jgi:hypothetical protein